MLKLNEKASIYFDHKYSIYRLDKIAWSKCHLNNTAIYRTVMKFEICQKLVIP